MSSQELSRELAEEATRRIKEQEAQERQKLARETQDRDAAFSGQLRGARNFFEGRAEAQQYIAAQADERRHTIAEARDRFFDQERLGDDLATRIDAQLDQKPFEQRVAEKMAARPGLDLRPPGSTASPMSHTQAQILVSQELQALAYNSAKAEQISQVEGDLHSQHMEKVDVVRVREALSELRVQQFQENATDITQDKRDRGPDRNLGDTPATPDRGPKPLDGGNTADLEFTNERQSEAKGQSHRPEQAEKRGNQERPSNEEVFEAFKKMRQEARERDRENGWNDDPGKERDRFR